MTVEELLLTVELTLLSIGKKFRFKYSFIYIPGSLFGSSMV